jgi:hypothetical protein
MDMLVLNIGRSAATMPDITTMGYLLAAVSILLLADSRSPALGLPEAA